MKIVIDTSILIDYLRGGTIWQQFLINAPREAELFLPTVVIFELFSGKSAEDPNKINKIDALLQKLQKVELTEEIARKAGELYRNIGMKIGSVDYLIAASALELNAKVVTLNQKHFKQIPNLAIYPI